MKKNKSGLQEGKGGESPSRQIDARIKDLGDWRGATLARVRNLIKEACPDVVEEWKWRGVPVWEHAGIICTGETYKAVVKLTFANGASLKDPSGLFNSSLEGNMRRAIDIHQDDKINERALKNLVRAAVDYNQAKRKKKAPAGPRAKVRNSKKTCRVEIGFFAEGGCEPQRDKIRCKSSISAPGAVTFGLWLESSSSSRQPSALARVAN